MLMLMLYYNSIIVGSVVSSPSGVQDENEFGAFYLPYNPSGWR